ncbi:MAG: hypothetical protein CMH53_08810 [Myxococcales bacterium]|nr:hypothetical protein [Myxococcales bacterium]
MGQHFCKVGHKMSHCLSSKRLFVGVALALLVGCSDKSSETSEIQVADGQFSADGQLYVDSGPLQDTSAATGGADTSANIDVGKGSDDGSCPSPCDDKLPCTLDSCTNGACSHALQPGFCLSGGACLTAGPVAGSPCLACKPEIASLSLQAVVGAPCDDGVDCTIEDSCDEKGSCTGKPSSGCCKTDVDCTSGAPCLAAICDVDTGLCKTEPKKNCCEQGVCCNPSTFSPHLAGTPCGTTSKQTEWACDGAQVRRRDAVDACDGANADTCGAGTVGLAWGQWKTISTCPQGQVCVLANSATQPGCDTAPECTSDAQCNDSKICTQDVCKDKSCQHPPSAAGTPCGSKALKTEYQCSSPNKGAAIQVRYAVSTCDGNSGICPSSSANPVWGQWQVLKYCGFNELCESKDPSQAAICVGAPQCKAGSTCCDDKGKYSAKGTVCSDKVVKTEYKCQGSKGGQLLSREAKPGCSGNSTTCFQFVSSYYAWSDWKTVKKCSSKEICEVKFSGDTGQCTTKTQCSAAADCCDTDGFYSAKGTKCGTSAWKTEQQCVKSTKGAKIQERTGWRGCSGTSTYCSSSTNNLVWEPWKDIKSCPTGAQCKESFGKAECVTDCKPTDVCCSATGSYEPKGTKCGTSVWKTEQQCVKSTKGAKIQERKGWRGCPGTSTYCSSSSTNLYWEPWKDIKSCPTGAQCKESFGKAECVTECSASQACCSATGTYEPKGTKCGNSSVKTETKCSSSAKGGDILERDAYYGCTGKSSSCSYSSTNYVWQAWKVKETCEKYETCEKKFSSPSCTSVCKPQSACCTALGEYETKGTQCSKSTSKTETKCSATGKEVLERKASRGCTGSSESCSYSSSNYVWSDWKTKKKCSSSQICKGTSSHYCGSK